MRIAFAGRLLAPITGAELVPIKILQQLGGIDRSNEYTLFLNEDLAGELGLSNERLTVRVLHRAWRRPLLSILWHQLVLPLFVMRHRIDVLFVPHNRVPLIKNCRHVVILHDLAEFRVPRKYDRLRSLYRQLILRRGVLRADRVVTVSQSSRQDIVSFMSVPPERVAVIYNGVGEEYFLKITVWEARARVSERFGVNEPYALYVGALEHPNKNLVRLLRAYAKARTRPTLPRRLLMVGPKRFNSQVIFEEVQRLHLEESVSWLGYVPKEDLPYLYAGAELFVYVSMWEGFGLPVLEALASGTPVIASGTSALPEVVGDAGLLVDPSSEDAIANAMESLCGDSPRLERMRRQGPERARMFSWKRAAASLLDVFESVAANPDRR